MATVAPPSPRPRLAVPPGPPRRASSGDPCSQNPASRPAGRRQQTAAQRPTTVEFDRGPLFPSGRPPPPPTTPPPQFPRCHLDKIGAAAAGPPPRPLRPPPPSLRHCPSTKTRRRRWAGPPPTPSHPDVSGQGCVRGRRSATHPSPPPPTCRQTARRSPRGRWPHPRPLRVAPSRRNPAPPALVAAHAGRRHWTVAAWRPPLWALVPCAPPPVSLPPAHPPPGAEIQPTRNRRGGGASSAS